MAKSNPINIRLEGSALNEVKQLAKNLRLSLSGLLNQLIIESIKMYHCPGILFINGPSGRRAVVSGSGLDVWEVISLFKEYKNEKSLLKDYPLSKMQLESALNYYSKYKKEIDEEISFNLRIEDSIIKNESLSFIQKVKV